MANVMALVGAGLGLLGASAGVGSSILSYGQSKKLQTHTARTNYEYSLKSARNTPLANRQGLEKAGYNPMLAVQNSTSGSNSSWTSNSGSTTPDLSNSISNVADFARLKNETDSVEALNDKNYAEADLAKVEKAKAIEELPYIGKKAKAEYMRTAMESSKLENDIHYQNEYLKYLDKSLEVQEKLGLAGIDVQKRGQDITYNASGIDDYSDRAKRYKKWGSKHPYLRNVDETISRYLGNSPVSFSKKLK